MKQPLYDPRLFSGHLFWDSKPFPENRLHSLDSLRAWASDQKLISDVESQLIASERTKALSNFFVPEDGLSILVQLNKHSSEKPGYEEYPYLPIKSLIKKNQPVEIVYWWILSSVRETNTKAEQHNEVRFGFWYPGVGEEFRSSSDAKLVIKNCERLYRMLPEVYERRTLPDGSMRIIVDGDIQAKFLKRGRSVDMAFI